MNVEDEVAAFVAGRRRALVRFGYLLTGDVAAAEDLVQEALLRCLSRWHRLDPAGTESYVRTVMSRLAWRARRRTPRPVVAMVEQATDDIADASAEAADLRAALAALPAQQRVALVLRYWEDLTETEMADRLGCRRGTVKSRLSRGYEQLRVQLGPADDAAPSAEGAGKPGRVRPSQWKGEP